MGKFVDEKAIVDKNIESFNNYINDTGKYIEGNVTHTTYYQKNQNYSFEDVGLGNVVEIIGSESPIKYNKIENFPLYGMTELNLSYDFDEDESLDNNIDGSAVILANTIKPLPDEFFSITYLNKDFLFRVNNVEGSHIGKKFYYKIDFSLSRSNIKILEENQIAERYEFDYDTLGSNNSPIIISDLYSRLEKIEDVMYELKTSYKKRYYRPDFNMFSYMNLIDDNIHYFLDKKVDLFITNKTYMENLKIEPILHEFCPEIIDKYYNHTIYNFFENLYENIDYLNDYYSNIISINFNKNGLCKLNKSYLKFEEILWIPNKIDNEDYTKVNLILSNFYNNLILNNIGENYLSDIVLYFIKDDISLESKIDNILELLKSNKKQLNIYNLEMYIFIPCILSLLNDLKNNILSQTNNFKYEKKGGNNNV